MTVKQVLLAGLFVLLHTQSLFAGNLGPLSSSYSYSVTLPKLPSHDGDQTPHFDFPKLTWSGDSSSHSWSYSSSSQSSSTSGSDDSSTHDWHDTADWTWPTDHWPSDHWPSNNWPPDNWPTDHWPTDHWPTDHWPTDHWPDGQHPSPWTWGGGFPGGNFPSDKIEQKFEDKFDTLSQKLDDLIASVPDYTDSADYQKLVDDIQHLIDHHSNFIDRVDTKIENVTNAIDKTNSTITHLNDVLNKLQNNTHIPAAALAQIEKQIENVQSRAEDRLTSLEAKKTDLENKLQQYGLFQTQAEDYLHNAQNSTTTPITTSTLAAEPVANSLAVNLNQVAAQVSQALADTSQPSTSSTADSTLQAAALQTTSTSEGSTLGTSASSAASDTSTPNSATAAASTGQSQASSSSTFPLSALQMPTVESVTPNQDKGEVQFAAGTNLHETVSGGAVSVGGVDVTFQSQAGGKFSSDYFQTANNSSLAQSIGQTAFDKINFLLSDELQGWELHFDGKFDGSASIVLGYDDSLLPPGIKESQLQIMHFNSVKGFWEVPDGYTINTDTNQISFWVNSFSPFLLTFNANSSANPEPSTGVIFSAGLLMLACRRKRKKASASA